MKRAIWALATAALRYGGGAFGRNALRKYIVPAALVSLLAGLASAPAYAGLIHDYELQGNYHDSLGGPDLVPDGGTLDPVKGYHFGQGQGLSLSNALPDGSSYAIELHFKLDLNSPVGWNKLIDPHNKGPDIGLYVSPSHNLYDYPASGNGPYTFVAGQAATVLWERNGTTQQVTGFVNGVQQWSYTDTSKYAVFNGPSNIIWFFEDDAGTGGREVSSGFVDQIQIFSGPTAVTPEPGSLTLLGLGALSLAGYGWRRRKQAVKA
jgi:hypothetical protein